eukprot:600308-Rhodomonas_salina.2
MLHLFQDTVGNTAPMFCYIVSLAILVQESSTVFVACDALHSGHCLWKGISPLSHSRLFGAGCSTV